MHYWINAEGFLMLGEKLVLTVPDEDLKPLSAALNLTSEGGSLRIEASENVRELWVSLSPDTPPDGSLRGIWLRAEATGLFEPVGVVNAVQG